MPTLGVDLTTAGSIPAGDYTAKVTKVTYEVRDAGGKWAKDKGLRAVSFEEFVAYPEQVETSPDHETKRGELGAAKRIVYTLAIPHKGNYFHRIYYMDATMGMIKTFFDACGCAYSKEGFDTDDPVGKDVGITLSLDGNGYNDAQKFYRA